VLSDKQIELIATYLGDLEKDHPDPVELAKLRTAIRNTKAKAEAEAKGKAKAEKAEQAGKAKALDGPELTWKEQPNGDLVAYARDVDIVYRLVAESWGSSSRYIVMRHLPGDERETQLNSKPTGLEPAKALASFRHGQWLAGRGDLAAAKGKAKDAKPSRKRKPKAGKAEAEKG
jgi:hypothetical protein